MSSTSLSNKDNGIDSMRSWSGLGRAANQRVAPVAETSSCFIDIATQEIDTSVAVANGNTNERLSSRVPIAAPGTSLERLDDVDRVQLSHSIRWEFQRCSPKILAKMFERRCAGDQENVWRTLKQPRKSNLHRGSLQ